MQNSKSAGTPGAASVTVNNRHCQVLIAAAYRRNKNKPAVSASFLAGDTIRHEGLDQSAFDALKDEAARFLGRKYA